MEVIPMSLDEKFDRAEHEKEERGTDLIELAEEFKDQCLKENFSFSDRSRLGEKYCAFISGHEKKTHYPHSCPYRSNKRVPLNETDDRTGGGYWWGCTAPEDARFNIEASKGINIIAMNRYSSRSTHPKIIHSPPKDSEGEKPAIYENSVSK